MSSSKYSHKDIDNILYSAIRNKDHLKVRKKTHLKNFLASISKWIRVKDIKVQVKNDFTILNFLPKSYIDLDKLSKRSCKKMNPNLRDTHLASISYIEGLLSLSFIINFKPFQRYLFKIIDQKVSKLVKQTNLKIVLCGHPTLSASFIAFYLKQGARNHKIVTVQHGIYNLKKYKVLWFEREIATHVIVYGKYFKNLYKEQGVPDNNLIIGNPYFSGKVQQKEKVIVKPIELVNKRVLFLGQQFYKVSEAVSTPYNAAINQLINHFESLDIDMYYKPHPREDINESLSIQNISRLKIFKKPETLESYLNSFDVFYSVNSTLLLEIYLQNQICYQVDLPFLDIENFSKYSGIPLLSEKDVEGHLQHEVYEFYYDHNYLNLQSSPKDALLRIIEKVISK